MFQTYDKHSNSSFLTTHRGGSSIKSRQHRSQFWGLASTGKQDCQTWYDVSRCVVGDVFLRSHVRVCFVWVLSIYLWRWGASDVVLRIVNWFMFGFPSFCFLTYINFLIQNMIILWRSLKRCFWGGLNGDTIEAGFAPFYFWGNIVFNYLQRIINTKLYWLYYLWIYVGRVEGLDGVIVKISVQAFDKPV